MARVTLSPETREFFASLAAVTVLNPFSDKRVALLEHLTPEQVGGAWSLDVSDYALMAEVDRRLAALTRDGGETLGDVAEEDRRCCHVKTFRVEIS